MRKGEIKFPTPRDNGENPVPLPSKIDWVRLSKAKKVQYKAAGMVAVWLLPKTAFYSFHLEKQQ
jgi:hypothetical protein